MPIYNNCNRRRHGAAVMVGDHFLTSGKIEQKYWRRHLLLLPLTFPTVAMALQQAFLFLTVLAPDQEVKHEYGKRLTCEE